MTAPWCSVSPETRTLRPELSRVRRAGRRLLDLLLPPRCAACDNPVTVQGQLCATCFGGMGFISAPMCSRCGVPFASVDQGGAEALCPGCRTHTPVFRSARAALRYDMQGRRLILPLKQSAGTPCLAKVKAGDRVSEGQIIGEPAPNALGAILHAPMTGIVREVSAQQIILEK